MFRDLAAGSTRLRSKMTASQCPGAVRPDGAAAKQSL